jgi:predicted RNA-binding protein with PIN domain
MLRKENQKIASFTPKENFPEEVENLNKWKLLKKRNKSLEKENQRLKRQVMDLKEENKKLRQKSMESEKKCEKCEHRLENYGIGGLGFQRESLFKAFNETETKKIKEKIREGEKGLLNDLKVYLEEAKDEFRRAEAEICQWGQIKLLIVDGHNLIFRNISQTDLLKNLESELEKMLRFTMIRGLAQAAEKLNCKIEAYFDTHNFQEDVKMYKNLTVYYCPKRMGGADPYILRRIRNIENGQNVVVVSSDRKHIWKRVNCLKSYGISVNCLNSETFFNYLSALEEFNDVSLQIEHYCKAIEENSQVEIFVVNTAGE